MAALRYATSLRPTTLRAVHFSLDGAHAGQLAERWPSAGTGVPLDLVDCPDRRLAHAAADLVFRETARPGTQVTAGLPRRSYSALPGRLLHDRTADHIAHVVSRIPGAAAAIIPFDVRHKTEVVHARQTAARVRMVPADEASARREEAERPPRPGRSPVAAASRPP